MIKIIIFLSMQWRRQLEKVEGSKQLFLAGEQ